MEDDGARSAELAVAAATLSEYASEDDYREGLTDRERWVGPAAAVARAHDIDPVSATVPLLTSYPVVLFGDEAVVKLYGEQRRGEKAWRNEGLALARLARDPDLPVPRTIAARRLSETWRYLITTVVPGRSLRSLDDKPAGPALASVARWLGATLRAIHAVPLDEEDRTEAWARFEGEIRWRHDHAVAQLDLRDVLPLRLRAQVEAWLPTPDELFDDGLGPAQIHGDLRDVHVLGHGEGASFEPAGIVDFNSGRIGHPMWDLPIPMSATLLLDRPAWSGFLDGLGLDVQRTPAGRRRILAWALLQGHPVFRAMRGLDEIGDLDDLAERLYGPDPGPLRIVRPR